MAKMPKAGNISPLILEMYRNEYSTDAAALTDDFISNTQCMHFKYIAALGILQGIS